MRDFYDPLIREAFDMANQLVRHCLTNDLDPTLVICGVAWNVEAISRADREAGRLLGIEQERDRIRAVLGLATL